MSAENEAGKVSLGIELDVNGISKQAGKLSSALEGVAEKAGKKAGEKLTEETAKSFEKGTAKAEKAGEKSGEKAGEGAEKGLKRHSGRISGAAGDAGEKAGGMFSKFFDKSSSNGISQVAYKIVKTIGAAFAAKKLFDFGKKSIELGSDLTEVQNVVDATFGQGSAAQKSIDSFAQNAATQFGLSETMAKRYAGTFGAMAKAFKFTDSQAAVMSERLTGLAGDVASFYNITQDEAYTKLKSVFTGETESLKELGIVMTQANLDQYALEQGLGATTKAMSEQDKVALRYSYVLDKLSTASGDFSRTSGSWANQVRLLKLQFESLAATIGQALIAALTPALRALNTFMGALVKAANSFKAFVFSLFGKESQDMAAGAGVTAAALDGIGDSAGSAADSLGNVGDAATGAGKDATNAANAIKRSLAGFDKITKLTDSSSSGSGSGSGGSGGSGGGGAGGGVDTSSMLKGTAWDLSGAESPLGDAFAKMLEDAWAKADFTQIGTLLGEKIRDGLDSIKWDDIQKKVQKISKSIATFLNGFLETEGLDVSVGSTIGNALNTGFEGVNTFCENFHWDSLGSFISTGIQTAFKTFNWGETTRFVSNVIKGVFNFGTGLLEGVNWKEVPGDICNAIKEAFDGFDFSGTASSIGKFIGTAIVSAIDLISGLADILSGFLTGIGDYFTEHIEEAQSAGGSVLDGILNGIIEGLKNIKDWVCTNILDPFIKGFKEAFGIHSPASNPDLLEAASHVGEGILDGIKNGLGTIADWVSTNILGPIKDALAEATMTVKVALEKVGEWAGEAWNAVKEGAKTIKKTVQAALEKAGDWAGDAWTAFKEGAKTVKKTVQAALEKAGDWAGDAWTAIQKGGTTAVHTLKSAVTMAKDWTKNTAWSAVKKGGQTLTHTLKSAVTMTKDWTKNTAWSAVKKGGKTLTHTLKSAVSMSKDWSKGTAWSAVKKGGQTLTHTLKSAVTMSKDWSKGTAWSAVKKGGESATHTLKSLVEKAKSWSDTAWTAANMGSNEVTRTVKVKVNISDSDKKILQGTKSGSSHYTLAHGGVFSGGRWHPIQSFEGGGSPFGGQLFRARENGNPELVGTLNGSTAVMNNNQIVASVSAGVARAIAGIKFYSEGTTGPSIVDRALPRLVDVSNGIRSDTAQLVAYAKQAEAMAGSGSNAEILEILRKILRLLEEMDFDVYIDGQKLTARLATIINNQTRATGRPVIIV